MRLVFIALFFIFGLQQALAQSAVYVVTSPSAAIYIAPQENKKSTSALQRGRRLQVVGPELNGFLPISTRSGSQAFIHAADVVIESAPEITSDITEPPSSPPAPTPSAQAPPGARKTAKVQKEPKGSILGLQRLSFDLGGSFGSIGNTNYSEFNLGLNAYFTDWLAWRNAVFARFASGYDTIYGLDSSVRGIFGLSGGIAGFTIFAGPGYRFINKGGNVPFAEAGLVLKVIGIALGGGVKVLLNSWVTSGAPNDTQYFIILSGGGNI